MTSVLASPPQIPLRVPPEVWLRIFGTAADLQALLNCDDPLSSGLPRTLAKRYELQGLKESLRTKRSMVLVCKTWNELALEFLYQNILITKVDALVSCPQITPETRIDNTRQELSWLVDKAFGCPRRRRTLRSFRLQHARCSHAPTSKSFYSHALHSHVTIQRLLASPTTNIGHRVSR
ncbi:hypothetical protein J3R82DRAFT_9081 [Butyriboletus roseoflavus]|nr:hypothetical protein J3R82DRAFT_9081 [Butyriboletus roseoflavus]